MSRSDAPGALRAFSLVELLIVVAIIAALVGAAVGFFQDEVKTAQRSRALEDLDHYRDAAVRYESLEGQGLLLNLRSLEGRYIAVLDPDPWGNPYFVLSGWIVSAGPTGDAGNPGGAWAWLPRAATIPPPKRSDGSSYEVPTGVPPADAQPPCPAGTLPPQPTDPGNPPAPVPLPVVSPGRQTFPGRGPPGSHR